MSVLLLLLVGCFGAPNEDNFIEKYSEAVCSFQEECDKAVFLEDYNDLDDCVDDSLDLYEDFDPSDCDFDKDKAKSCLDRINDATQDCDADDLDEEDCGEVFDCDGGGFSGGVTEENFGEKFFEAYCGVGCSADITALCNSVQETTSYDTSYTSTGISSCDFDAQAAAECVNPTNWTCEEIIQGSDDTYPKAPSVCDNVCG